MNDYSDLYEFIKDLKCADESQVTADQIELAYWYTRSDGCTGTLDLFKTACIIHDFHYRTHHDLSGRLINRREADKRFRLNIQRLSGFGVYEPLSWSRWLAVRCFGQSFWSNKNSCRI